VSELLAVVRVLLNDMLGTTQEQLESFQTQINGRAAPVSGRAWWERNADAGQPFAAPRFYGGWR
jgi:hypothetical protein